MRKPRIASTARERLAALIAAFLAAFVFTTCATAPASAAATDHLRAGTAEACTRVQQEQPADGLLLCLGPRHADPATTSEFVQQLNTSDPIQPANSSWCTGQQVGDWFLNRFNACTLGSIQINIKDPKTSELVGGATLFTAQAIGTNPSKAEWKEHDALKLYNVWSKDGEPHPVHIAWSTVCRGNCGPSIRFPHTESTEPDIRHNRAPWNGNFVPDQGVLYHSDQYRFDDDTLSWERRGPDVMDLQTNVTIFVMGTVPVTFPVLSWEEPTVRCDSDFVPGPGCVFPEAIPTAHIPSQYVGSSAAMIKYAQQHLASHWGSQELGGLPLHRGNPANTDANRRVICDSTFVAGSGQVPAGLDSCDEFPFASSAESGARNGVTSGAQCAQVTAVPTYIDNHEFFNSVTPTKPVSGHEKCIRGHIPLDQNEEVGLDLIGPFTQQYRVEPGDAYWVKVD